MTDTFTGVASLFGDRDYVRTRWLADPGAALLLSATGSLWGRTSSRAWEPWASSGPSRCAQNLGTRASPAA
jgi:hypothetical protein